MEHEALSLPRLIDEVKAAQMLGIKPNTLSSWRCLGRHGIPFIKIGKAVRYDVAALEEWMRKNTRTQTA